jgi:hypothetical protein
MSSGAMEGKSILLPATEREAFVSIRFSPRSAAVDVNLICVPIDRMSISVPLKPSEMAFALSVAKIRCKPVFKDGPLIFK